MLGGIIVSQNDVIKNSIEQVFISFQYHIWILERNIN